MTLSLTTNGTLNWLSSMPIRSHSGGNTTAPRPYLLVPNIVTTFMVSVDVKHHVYLLTCLAMFLDSPRHSAVITELK